MIPLWKSPIKLPLWSYPCGATRAATRGAGQAKTWACRSSRDPLRQGARPIEGTYKGCFSDFFQIIFIFFELFNVFCLKNVFFELLHAKPCRIIYKFHQNTILGPETCEIGSKVGNRTCPDLPRPVQEDKFLLQTSGFFFLFKNYTFPSYISKIIIFIGTICFH